MKYKHFEIRKPTILGKQPTEDYYKYNFDLVKWADDYSHCWSVGFLRYRTNGDGFEFESVGLRYLKYREEGLEEFILKWCELQEIIIENEVTENENAI